MEISVTRADSLYVIESEKKKTSLNIHNYITFIYLNLPLAQRTLDVMCVSSHLWQLTPKGPSLWVAREIRCLGKNGFGTMAA